ncbi:MAG TPA: Asp-tRNA(Asn)/Glu-tRNA(Gln) amidotransferase subunit GatC [Clostridia bacterium]|nr:Asp-tRNA(Asn)/Glu-tRNA(Gln) amidotransferase subunit GatC [Clostridia bacterium]
MKKISQSEVRHIAQLASLVLSAAELTLFTKQLSETLAFVATLEKLDTGKVKPTFQTSGLTNVVRSDEVRPSLSQEQALANAPSTYKGFFKVKSIFKPLI